MQDTRTVESLEELKDDLDQSINSLYEILNTYHELKAKGYVDRIVGSNVAAAINYAEIALDELRSEIEPLEE